MIHVALLLVGLGGLGFTVRAVRGPSLADRIVGLDGLAITVVAAAVLIGVDIGTPRYVDVALVVAFVGFVGATSVARFVERRGG